MRDLTSRIMIEHRVKLDHVRIGFAIGVAGTVQAHDQIARALVKQSFAHLHFLEVNAIYRLQVLHREPWF